jgi:hypothetical protein
VAERKYPRVCLSRGLKNRPHPRELLSSSDYVFGPVHNTLGIAPPSGDIYVLATVRALRDYGRLKTTTILREMHQTPHSRKPWIFAGSSRHTVAITLSLAMLDAEGFGTHPVLVDLK